MKTWQVSRDLESREIGQVQHGVLNHESHSDSLDDVEGR
jgi:hypothetical protein